MSDELKALRQMNTKKNIKHNLINSVDNNSQSSSSVEETIINETLALPIDVCKSPQEVTEQDYNELEEIVKVNEIVTNTIESSKTISVIQRPISSSNNNFNQMELCRLMEIFTAVKFLEIDFNKPINVHMNETFQDFYSNICYFYEHHTRKLIKTIKFLNSFDVIDNMDKLTLVKNSALEILILRSVLRYDQIEESWKYPVSNLFLSSRRWNFF